MEKYKINLLIADIKMNFKSDIPLNLLHGIKFFQNENIRNDINIEIKFSDNVNKPNGKLVGNDLMFNYYDDGHFYYEEAIKGKDGSVSLIIYTYDFSSCTIYINEKKFPNVIRSFDKILQLMPMKQILTYHKVLMLHSSRILVNNKALLFTAPSQTGKTTQAMLWKRKENAEILSNDRSLLRMFNDICYTYGYPIDGSNPIYNNEKIELGAIIVLRQSKENSIEKLDSYLAIKYLMEQSVFDDWNNKNRIIVMQLWLDLLCNYPIYLLKCRPDYDAVITLKQKLLDDEVIDIGKD